ncbi:hypothetical protein AB0B27_25180 [Micromonospora rifamycinica]|uniref:3'-5' exonuclease n=1 Tax=Micromonospora rifamycinica TaxID=291594 RepID=UPI0033E83ACA
MALVRVEGGRVVDEWATLVDPGRDPGPTFIHHITADMLSGAPTFADAAGEILSRLGTANTGPRRSAPGTVVPGRTAPACRCGVRQRRKAWSTATSHTPSRTRS